MTEELERLSRKELAGLGREYLLAGHLIDRAGMPYVIAEFGREAMRDVAIEEWMGASPVYTRRIRRALGFDGDDVATIFKGMQFDIGAPHQFMDFRFVVHDEHHGEFFLASCGALLDVEPLGTEFVVTMCHHIEDPTFDATAAATNPRARMRPVHRPPRLPADRTPHCNWTVTIEPDAEPLPEPEAAVRVARSRAASIRLGTPATEREPGGRTDYAGALDPDMQLEDFSHGTLVTLLKELGLQGHLVARSFMLALERRYGRDVAERLGARQLTGIAGLVAKRLTTWIGSPDVARVLKLHPAFMPREYVAFSVDAGEETRVSLGPCEGMNEGDLLTWPALLAAGRTEAIESIVQAVDPTLRCTATMPEPGGPAAWTIERSEAESPVSDEVRLASFTTGAEFRFVDRAK